MGRYSHYIILTLACLLMGGNYYTYDIPAAINTQLRDYLETPYDIFQYQLNLLYSIYAFPNILMPLLGGILIDKLGVKPLMISFSFLVLIGQTLFSCGIWVRNFSFILLGRFVAGIGGESLECAQSAITTDYFRGRGLSFALAVNLSFARVATALNDNFSPYIAKKANVYTAAFIGTIFCAVSFLAGITIAFYDNNSLRNELGILNDKEESQPLISSEPSSNSDTLRINVQDYDEKDEQIYLSQLSGLNFEFWILCCITICVYGSTVPFFHICTDFFQQKWYQNDPQSAGLAMSIPDFISALGGPLCGLFIDKYGQKALIIPISAALILLTHILLCFTTVSPLISMAILGVGYSLFPCAIFPCIPALVGRHQIATGYGIITVALNLSLSVMPFIVAQIRNLAPEDFQFVQYLFMLLNVLAIVLGLYLRVLDKTLDLSILEAEIQSTSSSPTIMLNDQDMVVKSLHGFSVMYPKTLIHHHHLSISSPTNAPCTCYMDNSGTISVRGVYCYHPSTVFLPEERYRRASH